VTTRVSDLEDFVLGRVRVLPGKRQGSVVPKASNVFTVHIRRPARSFVVVVVLSENMVGKAKQDD
jgi:hypothetical protein